MSVPEWLDEDTLRRWLVALGAGGGVFAVALGAAYVRHGLLPADPGDWLPAGRPRRRC